jgi:hypothetical protein
MYKFFHDYFTHEEGRPPKAHPNQIIRYPLLVGQVVYFLLRSIAHVLTPPGGGIRTWRKQRRCTHENTQRAMAPIGDMEFAETTCVDCGKTLEQHYSNRDLLRGMYRRFILRKRWTPPTNSKE